MKVALLLVACLAFASASYSPMEPQLAALMPQAISFCAYSANAYCAAGNGSSCASSISGTVVTQPYCPSGTYLSDASRSSTCKCKAYDFTTVTLGSACTVGQTSQDGSICTTKGAAYPSDSNTYWFSPKLQGDTCSGAFDCSPPRTCVNSVCKNRLNTGDVCYNSTGGIYLNTWCSIKDYCPSTGTERVCTARLAQDADCTNTTSACPTYQQCLTSPSDLSLKTCQTPRWYWIPAGQKYNTSVLQCYSGLADATTQICADYDAAYSAYQAKAGASCSADSDCTTYGSCSCTNQGSSDAAACTWDHDSHATLVSAYATSIAKTKKYYDAACEWGTSGSSQPPSNNNAYCIVALGDYQSTYTVCGAFHNMALSSVTIVLSAIFATLLAKW